MKSVSPRSRSDAFPERPKVAVSSQPANLPQSVTNGWIIAAGFITFLASLWLVRSLKMQDAVKAGLICVSATALVNYALDVIVLKVHRRESTGLDWQRRSPSWSRVATKFLGLLASFGFIAALYWLFPEYHNGDAFYKDYWELLRIVLPWWIGLAIPYFFFVDARQTDPNDGYYHAGRLASLHLRNVNWKILIQHSLGWLVKGYFMPLMFTYFTSDLRKFIAFDFSTIRDFRTFYEFGYYFVFLADVTMACIGYLIALRLLDTHLRSAEPTGTGWLVALACYQPFWSLLSRQYLDYSRDFAWGAWLQDHRWLYCLWGSTILILYAIYLWATVIFGCRFSNLTHRGILTNGPYRWTKHPAYLAKNLAYWMTFVPFIVSANIGDSIRRCALLGLTNWIYYVRAKTEEAHLGRDPAYVQYKDWIARHGIFRWLSRK